MSMVLVDMSCLSSPKLLVVLFHALLIRSVVKFWWPLFWLKNIQNLELGLHYRLTTSKFSTSKALALPTNFNSNGADTAYEIFSYIILNWITDYLFYGKYLFSFRVWVAVIATYECAEECMLKNIPVCKWRIFLKVVLVNVCTFIEMRATDKIS